MKILQINIIPINQSFLITVLLETEKGLKAIQKEELIVNDDTIQNTINRGYHLTFLVAKALFVKLSKRKYLEKV